MAFRSYRSTAFYPGFFIGQDNKSSNQSSVPSERVRSYVGSAIDETQGFYPTGGITGSGGLFAYGSTGTSPSIYSSVHRDLYFGHLLSDYGTTGILRMQFPGDKDSLTSASPGYPDAERIATYSEQPNTNVSMRYDDGTIFTTTGGVEFDAGALNQAVVPTYDGLIWTGNGQIVKSAIVCLDFYGNVHHEIADSEIIEQIRGTDSGALYFYDESLPGQDGHGYFLMSYVDTTTNGDANGNYHQYNVLALNRDGRVVANIWDPGLTAAVAPPTDYKGFGQPSYGGAQIGCGRIVVCNAYWSDTSVNAAAWTEGNTGHARGKIYIYDMNFRLVRQLSGSADHDFFGWNVRIAYDRIYVSSPGCGGTLDAENTSKGRVFMYDLNGNLIEEFNFGSFTAGSAEAFGWHLEVQDTRVIVGSNDDKTNSNGVICVFNIDGESQGLYFTSSTGGQGTQGRGSMHTGGGMITYQHRLGLGTYMGQTLSWISIRDTYGFVNQSLLNGKAGGFLDYEKHTMLKASSDSDEFQMVRSKAGMGITPQAGQVHNTTISDTDNTVAAPGIEFNEDGKIYKLGQQYTGNKEFIGYWCDGTVPRKDALSTYMTITAYKPSGNNPNGTTTYGTATEGLNTTLDLPNGDGTVTKRHWYWQYSDSSSGTSYLRFTIRPKYEYTPSEHMIGTDLRYFQFDWDNTGNTISEVVTLSGTTSSPVSAFGLTPGVDTAIGWEFRADGTVYRTGSVNDGTYLSGTEWINTTPSSTYYIRFTSNSGDTPTASYSDTLNTWHALTSTRRVRWYVGSWQFGSGSAKVEIATDSGGSNIVATGYYGHNTESGE
jgi:hypothetical protein